MLDALRAEEDDLWSEVREPEHELSLRAGRFLHTLRARPEEHIAVVTHNDFLTALLFDSELRLADEALRRKFKNAEHMAFVLTWAAAEEGAADGGGAHKAAEDAGGAAAIAAGSSASRHSAAE